MMCFSRDLSGVRDLTKDMRGTGVELHSIDRAVLTAAGLMRDFSDSDNGRGLTPMQRLSVMTIVAFDHTRSGGVPAREAVAKLRELADALEGI